MLLSLSGLRTAPAVYLSVSSVSSHADSTIRRTTSSTLRSSISESKTITFEDTQDSHDHILTVAESFSATGITSHSQNQSSPDDFDTEYEQLVDDCPHFLPPAYFSKRFGTQFFTISVPEFTITCEGVFYTIVVKRGRQEAVVKYRYSEIASFREEVRSRFEIGLVAYALPFPSKNYLFWRDFDTAVLERRRMEFEEYFARLFQCSASLARTQMVRDFFGLDSFVTDVWWKESGYGHVRRWSISNCK